MARSTAQRNLSAALVVGGQNFDDPRVLDMVVVVAPVGLLILMPMARMLGKRIGVPERPQQAMIRLPR
jgi:BASS family bile acid:Na+ symporter